MKKSVEFVLNFLFFSENIYTINSFVTTGSQQFCFSCKGIAIAVAEYTEPNDSLILGLWVTVPRLEETANE